MTLHVSVGGVNKRVIAIWVGVNGAWKRVLGGWTSVASVHKKFFSSGEIVSPLSGGTIYSIAYDGVSNTSTLTFNTDGTISVLTDGVEVNDTITGQRWFTDDPDQTYEIFATLVSTVGTGTTTGTFSTWLPLTTEWAWAASRNGGTNGARTVNVKFKIRRQSDSVVVSLDTNNYAISVATNTGAPP